MPVLAAALFGSRARGDNEPESDTDILFITPEKHPYHIVRDNLSISMYPKDFLIEKSQIGDLFLCHIAHEAKVLYDSENTFEDVVRAFCYKQDYSYEVKCATELGIFLCYYGLQFTSALEVNRKIAWCVRTILIARSAENRQPIFSPVALSEFAKSDNVLNLIRTRSGEHINKNSVDMFFQFLAKWGSEGVDRNRLAAETYYKMFVKSENKVAIKTYNRGWLEADPSYL